FLTPSLSRGERGFLCRRGPRRLWLECAPHPAPLPGGGGILAPARGAAAGAAGQVKNGGEAAREGVADPVEGGAPRPLRRGDLDGFLEVLLERLGEAEGGVRPEQDNI